MAYRTLSCVFMLGSLLLACSDSSDNEVRIDRELAKPFAGFVSPVYRGSGNWLCHPELDESDNVCSSNLDAIRVFADGFTEIEPHLRAAEPEVDCFYVYPTVSVGSGSNSDLEKGPQESFTTVNQAARYSRFCRIFAPVYRQVTLAAIADRPFGDAVSLAYADVLDSFKHYMGNNNGRGVILIGHSQGASYLKRLFAETIKQ